MLFRSNKFLGSNFLSSTHLFTILYDIRLQKIKTILFFILTFIFFTVTGQQLPKINKNGQYNNVLHIRFKPSLTKKIDRELQGKDLKNAKKNEYLQINLKDVDHCNKMFQTYTMKRLFRPAGKFEAKHRKHGLHLWYEIRFDTKQEIDKVIAAYQNATSIEIAEPVYEVKYADGYNENTKTIHVKNQKIAAKSLDGVPNDPRYGEQWHYNNTGQSPDAIVGNDINIEEAWKIQTGNSQVTVAIMDTGFDVNHPDLKGNLWVNPEEIPGNNIDDDNNGYIDDIHGYNFADDTGTISAGDHGTHVAGTVAAETNNNIGVAGVAGGSGNNDGVRLMATSVFGNGIANIMEAYVYAADNGAVISQNSWGYGVFTIDIRASDKAAIDYFIANAGGAGNAMNGGTVIFASGNNGAEGTYYPAKYDPILSVSSLANSGKKASYSNYGTWVDISAPGGDQNTSGTTAGILSTTSGGGYGYKQGTSMACPHASGVAALVVSEFAGNISGIELKHIMENSTDPVDQLNTAYVGKLGSGRINALKALQYGNATVDTPNTIEISNIGARTAIINWNAVDQALRYTVRYRKNNDTWIENTTNATNIKITNLSKSSSYEVQVRAESLSKVSTYSPITSFITLELEVPNTITVSSIEATKATIHWNATTNANQYTLRYKKRDETNWITNASITSLSSTLTTLAPNIFYEVQVKASNATLSSIFSDSVSFLTLDDGSGGCNGIAAWENDKVYADAGYKVAYQGFIYVNKWWTQGNTPNNSSAWEKIGECDPPGNQPPSVTITTPTNGQIIQQDNLTAITLSANATDTDGIINSIQFEVNGTPLAQGNNINWTPIAFGAYTIKVTATDDKGATATHQVNITIQQKTDNQPPTVNISQPTEGQIFEQEVLTAITLSADASDTDGTIASVQFEINGTVLTQGNNISWTPAAFGDYTIKVTATDDKGATATHQVNITIQQKTDNQPPTVNISQPTEGQIFEQEVLTAITLSADASDTDGTIASVQFEVNGTTLTQGNNMSWTPAAFGDYTITVTVTDDKGATATHQVTITIKNINIGGDCNGISAWDPNTIYPSEGGVQVSHNDNIYENKWWTQNEEPGTGGPWGSWELIEPCPDVQTKPIHTSEMVKVGINSISNQMEVTFQQKLPKKIKISMYTIDGRFSKQFTNQLISKDTHSLFFDITTMKEGFYLLRIEIDGSHKEVKKVMILK